MYNERYAARYIEHTLGSSYTQHKNRVIAELARFLDAAQVLDLGSNVNGTVKRNGSLRYKLSRRGIDYVGLDLSQSYFDKSVPKLLGLSDSEIFEENKGIVADIANIPLKDNSVDFSVCADVIEHVSDPARALSEISRVTSENGKAIIVVPSLYKLDGLDLNHIKEKRHSSHESKLTVSQWLELSRQAGLVLDQQNSQPIGIASGLLYLTWLDEEFVPEKCHQEAEERFSGKAEIFKKAKKAIGKHDEYLDNFFTSSPEVLSAIGNAASEGVLTPAIDTLKYLATNFLPAEDQEMVTVALANFNSEKVPLSRLTNIADTIASLTLAERSLFLGNSALLVFGKN